MASPCATSRTSTATSDAPGSSRPWRRSSRGGGTWRSPRSTWGTTCSSSTTSPAPHARCSGSSRPGPANGPDAVLLLKALEDPGLRPTTLERLVELALERPLLRVLEFVLAERFANDLARARVGAARDLPPNVRLEVAPEDEA